MKPNYLYVFGGEKAQGAEIVVERLICANAALAHNHLILSPGDFAGKLMQASKPYSITILPQLRKLNRSFGSKLSYYIKALKNYLIISRAVQKYVKRHQIQLIHVNTIVPAAYLLPLLIYYRLIRKKMIWVWSDHDIAYFSALEHRLSKICAKLYHLTLVVSNAVKSKYGNNNKVKLLYNGLNPDDYKPDGEQRSTFRKVHNISQTATVIGMPGVVNPRKGQLALLNVFNRLCKQHGDIVLLLAGGYETAFPDYAAEVVALIEQNERIVHLGYVDHINAFYNACDIVVNNSNLAGSEPLGTTIYEAMACEKVILASATGGTPEIVDDGINGYLFEPENLEELAVKLTLIIGKLQEQDTLRQNARKKVIAQFGIDWMVKEYNILLSETTGE